MARNMWRRRSSARALTVAMGLLALMLAFIILPSSAGATETNDQVCTGLDSGKIDTTGDSQTVTVTAPEGKLIDQYCVKAGSSNQGDGPRYVTVNPPVKTLTITHPSGKDISHYSVSYVTDACPDMGGAQPPGTDCDQEPPTCGEDPTQPGCPEDPTCEEDPTQPGCPEDPTCEEDPTQPGCEEEPPPCIEKCPVPDTMGNSKGNLKCVGTVRGGVYENVRVLKGKSCKLINVHVNKNVFANGAKNVRILDTTVVRSVDLDGVKHNVKIGNKVGCKYDPQVGRSIYVTNSHNVLICEMTVCEDIVLRGNDGQVTVRHSSARRISITGTHKLVRPYSTAHRNPQYIRVLDSRAESFTARFNHKSRKLITRGSIFESN